MPRNLVYQLENTEKSPASFSRLYRVLEEQSTQEDVILEHMARQYQLPLLPKEIN